MSSDPVLSAFDPARGVATLTFNRPETFNALDQYTAAAFEAAVASLRRLAGLRCVVLTGAGKAFMAGGDVGAFAADPPNAPDTLAGLLRHMHPAIEDLRALAAPVVAAVNGSAAGAGFSLVLGADYVVAKQSSKLVLAYDKLATVPDCGGSWFLARKVGRAAAFDLMLNGRTLTADDARAIGLVNEVVDDAEFDGRVIDVADRIANGPTLAFGMFKRLLDEEVPLSAQLARERQAFMHCAATSDFAEAVTAFVGKTKPGFAGR